MDAAAETIAALSNEHRDEVSNPGQNKLLTNAEKKTQRGFNLRREMVHDQAKADAGNEQFAKLSAWNKPESFSTDSLVDGLTDHFSGQGHRPGMMASLGIQEHSPPSHRSQAQSHFGGSGRRNQGSGAQGDTATGPSSHGPRGSRQAGLSLPMGFPKAPATAPVEATKTETRNTFTPGMERPPVHHTRAEARTVRATPAPTFTGTPIRIPRTAATSDSASSVRITAQDGTAVRPSATAASPSHSAARMSSPASSTRTSATTTATIVRVPAVRPASTAVPPADIYRHAAHVKMAEHYAKNPGEEADKYHAMFPARRQYLAKAIEELAQKQTASLVTEPTVAKSTSTGNTAGDDQAEKAVAEATPKVKDVVEKKIVQKTSTDNAAVGKKTLKDHTKKQVVDETAVLEEEGALPVIKKETFEETSKAKTMRAPRVQPSHKPDRQDSATSVDISTHSRAATGHRSPESSVATPAVPSPPQMPMYGKLVVTYLDKNSNHLLTHSMDINAPVQASIQLTSQAADYDPCKLAMAMSTLAKTMRMPNSNMRLERGSDGLWQDPSDDDDL